MKLQARLNLPSMREKKRIAIEIRNGVMQQLLPNFKEVLESDAFVQTLVDEWNDDIVDELRHGILNNLTTHNCVVVYTVLQSRVILCQIWFGD